MNEWLPPWNTPRERTRKEPPMSRSSRPSRPSTRSRSPLRRRRQRETTMGAAQEISTDLLRISSRPPVETSPPSPLLKRPSTSASRQLQPRMPHLYEAPNQCHTPLGSPPLIRIYQDLPGCPARKSGEEWQPVAKRRHIPSWFTKAPPGRAGLFLLRLWSSGPTHCAETIHG